MILAQTELAKRKADDEADKLFRLALLALSLFYVAREFQRIAIAYELARHFAPVLSAGEQIAGAGGEEIRAAARDGLQDFFSNQSRALAFERDASSDTAKWRASMSSLIVSNTLQQKTLALNRPLLPSDALDLIAPLNFELSHLERFASEIDAKSGGATALSARQVAARSELYSGTGRAVWFRVDERGKASGVVIYYEAVDDAGTCSPCLDAENASPYLPGEGAMPGSVCLGRGRCRCLRIPRDAPAEYARLTKRAKQLRKAAQL